MWPNLSVLASLSIILIFCIQISVFSLTTEDFSEKCLDGRFHKKKPGPEDSLHKQCTPWANRSCCTSETSEDVHYKDMYNFKWNHCQEEQDLSDECRKHFVQDLCFYECSPNIGPWLVKVEQKIRNEKFFEVPLCASDCDRWFEACKDDRTCTNNWGRNFEWVKVNGKMVNKCPAGSKCMTFQQVFTTAKDFCEQIWDHSWKYTPNDKPCMRLWFDGTKGNPNDNVLRWKIAELVINSTATINFVPLWSFLLVGASNLFILW